MCETFSPGPSPGLSLWSVITTGDDFPLRSTLPPGVDCVITNPPFRLGAEFIRHALKLMESPRGMVAMLLRIDFDSAETRADIFDHPAFAKKVVLRDRIRWFEGSTGAPSFNHAWFLWDWQHQGPPTIAYACQLVARSPTDTAKSLEMLGSDS
jgi:hypothetical protein